jgi:hypothetical protein
MRWLVHQGKIKAGSETAICETGIGMVTAAHFAQALLIVRPPARCR